MKTLVTPSWETPTSATPPPSTAGEWSLVDWYLEQQGQLTAVEQFARVQDQLSDPVYRSLLPAKPPGPGEQYAFEVDLDRCSGCKACVTACHSLNGLDDTETWREVGLLTGGHEQAPFQQHVTTACHHCVEPACMDVCPTLAYEKDATTGIVKHLDDQCFGCQYCILACPYNVPRYNARLGIVRKCDMCSQRLAVGESPACVQACPHEAIRIQIVSTDQVQADAESSQFLPGTPDPQYTLPTTNYKTERALPRNLMPADYYRVQVEHSHRPLVAMLVLSQLAVGGFGILAAGMLAHLDFATPAFQRWQSAIALTMCYIALTASTLHLGRPWLAYRAMLGLRTSWLSREILAFGLFAAAATWRTWQAWFPAQSHLAAIPMTFVDACVLATGLAGVFCSAMIYHRTKRPFWNIYQTGLRFSLTTLLLGGALAWVSLAGTSAPAETRLLACQGILAVAVIKGLGELGTLAALLDRPQTPLKRTALLLVGPLRQQLVLRYVFLVIGSLLATGFMLSTTDHKPRQELVFACLSLFSLVCGEWLARSLFFKASVAFRMPGGPTA